MKKPFLLLNTYRDIAKFCFCLLLSLGAFALFFVPQDGLAVFSDGGNSGAQSLYGLLSRLV